MYFIKKNLINIIICVLAFGVIGTAVNFFIPPSSTTYEEYYTLESGLEPNSIANLNIQLNETVNNASDNIRVASVEGQSGSDMLKLVIGTESGINYNSIHAQAMDIIAGEGIVTADSAGLNTFETPNTALKLIIILISLLIGAAAGIIIALNNRNISTEEDIQHYLGERTLGTF
ncbi:hypothetical protein GCM10007275_06780 [Jeotgalicoccus coquinae]|uniref:Capsular polysaccharide biosynthesis protein n=1 Tax=Jeotgalicoccus coquinae TaxID=709509 RepID=A0A6V7RJN4_9STAP|nr:hypothetical protein [Jeotgalicoccus coquinae]MBB6422654.1 capsular polysaccharide biosynthesis protein [Jeotgalicoccus coquinae]GGE14211.1 hypothetical protein GCM10007275_06780 [Jeotgalicoccus coquinae]CAD2077644.1 hypothetical protein JEOCOQ751_01006 [Jeotgalicoccus coquinae]